MSTMNILTVTLIVLILSCVLALVIGTRPAQAGHFTTPAGGWGMDRPAPPMSPAGGVVPGSTTGSKI